MRFDAIDRNKPLPDIEWPPEGSVTPTAATTYQKESGWARHGCVDSVGASVGLYGGLIRRSELTTVDRRCCFASSSEAQAEWYRRVSRIAYGCDLREPSGVLTCQGNLRNSVDSRVGHPADAHVSAFGEVVTL